MIEGNYIGVAGDGRSALPNVGVSLYVEISLQNNFIGRNVISAKYIRRHQFLIRRANNVMQNNYIGLASDGETPAPNGGAGIYLFESQSNLIGGVAPGLGNVISANLDDGIQLYGSGTSFNTVEGNLVGTTKTGQSRLGSLFSALSLIAGPTSNTIGGAGRRPQCFSGSSNYDGVSLDGASNNVVRGNYIGTDASGLVALTNAEYGLTLFGTYQSNLILGNVIWASANYGVVISDPGTSGNIFQGNNIGVGADRVTLLGNAWQGMILEVGAATNIIGLALDGSGADDVIADNGYEGVILYGTNTIGNCLRGNSIYSNGAIGINLVGGSENSYGVTANHVGGAVPGPNDLQNYPVLTAAAVFSNSTVITGTINSGPGQNISLTSIATPVPIPPAMARARITSARPAPKRTRRATVSFSCRSPPGWRDSISPPPRPTRPQATPANSAWTSRPPASSAQARENSPIPLTHPAMDSASASPWRQTSITRFS